MPQNVSQTCQTKTFWNWTFWFLFYLPHFESSTVITQKPNSNQKPRTHYPCCLGISLILISNLVSHPEFRRHINSFTLSLCCLHVGQASWSLTQTFAKSFPAPTLLTFMISSQQKIQNNIFKSVLYQVFLAHWALLMVEHCIKNKIPTPYYAFRLHMVWSLHRFPISTCSTFCFALWSGAGWTIAHGPDLP